MNTNKSISFLMNGFEYNTKSEKKIYIFDKSYYLNAAQNLAKTIAKICKVLHAISFCQNEKSCIKINY